MSKFRNIPWSWRSGVLNPILQRQLQGVNENYRPLVEKAVAKGGKKPTLEQVTKFYLVRDPVDPRWIRTYRRNLLYISEARWHLGVVMGTIAIGDEVAYAALQDRTDVLQQQRKMDYSSDG